MNKKKKNIQLTGFTLMELLIGFAIITIVIIVAGLFIQNIIDFGGIFEGSFEARSEINQFRNAIDLELRTMSSSETGAFPVDTAASSTLIFYSDLDLDGNTERLRYFLDGQTLKKGIIRPTGNPPNYNPSNEVLIIAVNNVLTGPSSTFSYYDQNYTGTEPPLSSPVSPSSVRIIEINLRAKTSDQSVPAAINLKVAPRNLRTNL